MDEHVYSRLEKLEKTISDMSEKIEKLEEAKSHKNKNMDLMEAFFNKHLVESKGDRVITSDVWKKMNDFVASENIEFSKYVVSNFIKIKGLERKKVGSREYYYDVKFVNIVEK